MLLDRIGPPAEVPRVNLLCHPYAREGQAVVCPLLRGSSPTRWVAPKQHRGLRRAFSPAFRAGGIPLSLGAWVPKNLARRKRKTRRLLTNRPCSSLVYEESDSKERLRVSNWIVQRLYNYAVKKTCLLYTSPSPRDRTRSRM